MRAARFHRPNRPVPLRHTAAALLLGVPAATLAAQSDTIQAGSFRQYVGCDAHFCARVTWAIGPTLAQFYEDGTPAPPETDLYRRLTLTARPGVPDGVIRSLEFGQLGLDSDDRYPTQGGEWSELRYLPNVDVPGGFRVGVPVVLLDDFETGQFLRGQGRPTPPLFVYGIVSDAPIGTGGGQFGYEVNITALVATPEPATVGLAGAGALLLGAWARRRRA